MKGTVTEWNVPAKPGNNLPVVVDTYIESVKSDIWIFYKGIEFRVFKFRGDFYSRVFHFAIFLQSRKTQNKRPAKFSTNDVLRKHKFRQKRIVPKQQENVCPWDNQRRKSTSNSKYKLIEMVNSPETVQKKNSVHDKRWLLLISLKKTRKFQISYSRYNFKYRVCLGWQGEKVQWLTKK